ncbi:hypothetical protein M426DRAFT_322554 [Hypoxylon sp. CI-4A]|nr:hypothetical protein M426DRAFT_322554 [Hypoxylon sp. CI-4A]
MPARRVTVKFGVGALSKEESLILVGAAGIIDTVAVLPAATSGRTRLDVIGITRYIASISPALAHTCCMNSGFFAPYVAKIFRV